MRTEHPRADRVLVRLERLTASDAIDIALRHSDDDWLVAALTDNGPKPIDRGVYWVALPDDAIYPIRLLTVSRSGTHCAVWITVDPDDGYAFVVLVHPAALINDWQAGESGRAALRSGQDAPDAPRHQVSA
ncbi:MAG: hypothetical protein IT433_13485 [Phycisphaerales bacterium]|nr:hypothetical protein [Phycisphaerales bacterium]